MEQFRDAPDKLAFVMNSAVLFGPTDIRERAVKLLLEEPLLSSEQRTEVSLGLTYMLRDRDTRSGEELLEHVHNIRSQPEIGQRSKILSKIVHGAVLVTHFRRFDEAMSIAIRVREHLRADSDHLLYALAVKLVADIHLFRSEHVEAENEYHEAIATFRRFGHRLLDSYTTNNLAIVVRRLCEYSSAKRLLLRIIRAFDQLGVLSLQVSAYDNLGTVGQFSGDWTLAEHSFRRSYAVRDLLLDKDEAPEAENIYSWCDTSLERQLMYSRKFDESERLLRELVQKYADTPSAYRTVALCKEFLGEIALEKGEFKPALELLNEAYEIAMDRLPETDVMTEVLRRRADVYLRLGRIEESRADALRGIRLCKQIGDRYELGASIRVLGQIHHKTGETKKARACFETATHTLKSIGECYELMRANVAYGSLLNDLGDSDAEIQILEARQLSKKLELDYYLARVNVELARAATIADNHNDAREYIAQATELYDTLQDCDQRQIKPLLDAARSELDATVIKAGIRSAQELKVMCRLYEEARFPMDDAAAEMSYQLAQSVGAESMFLVRRKWRGYEIALNYNLPKGEAKEIVRRLDRDKTIALLDVGIDPRLHTTYTGKSMVCVPGVHKNEYVLCTLFDDTPTLTQRQFEMLFTGVEALERLVVDTPDEPGPTVDEEFVQSMPKVLTHPRGSFKDILTVDREMIKVIHLAERAAQSDAPILLQGETGVGKELFARAIHQASRRSDAPFVAINAGGMPVNLLESQLFGHVKGAFTDAVADRTGLVEEARGGTILLDEVGEMGEEMQVKLLRLLENGEYRKLGDNKTQLSDIRVISATNRDLEKESEAGLFRSDLYYRLGAVTLSIPALRFRTNDIQLLVRHFIRECAARNRIPERHFQFDVKAVEALELYNWPGNVRELHNEMMRLVSLIGADDIIRFGMLSEKIKRYMSSKHRADGLLEQTVENFERRLILEALERYDWNRKRTATEIGVPRTTLLAKMKRLNIAPRPL